MRHRTAPFTVALLLLAPLLGAPGFAEPVLNPAVAPTEVMDEIGAIVRKEFFDPKGLSAFDAAESRLKEAAARGRLAEASSEWLETLRATHTGRFTPDGIDYYELSEVFHRGIRNRQELFPPEGIVTYPGIGMAARPIEGKLFAARVYDGGPADRAGIVTGDEILSVDGKPYAPIASFQGKTGGTVDVEVRRTRDAPPMIVPVPVEVLQPRDVFLKAIRESARIIEQDGRRIAYLRIWAFAFNGVEELVADLLTSEPLRSAEGLVLDIRGRWGGAPADAADMFVGHAPHMTVTDRGGEEEVANMRWQKPVVAIIDAGSRSGMEILAHGLKNAEVPLIGAKTAGAVVAGRAFRLKDNSLLEVAVLDVHVDGRRLEGVGVVPDVEVPFDLRYAAGADPQLDRALAEMRTVLTD
jgi:C-terminal processing protease CtpA/Prc